MFENKTVTKQNITELKKIFHSLDGLHSKIFNPSWNVLFFESSPFFDEDIYPSIISFFNEIKETEINILGYPLDIGDKYFRVKNIPVFEVFETFQIEYYFKYIGGIAYGANLNWGMHADADNSILILGYAPFLISEKLMTMFRENKFLVTKERLIEDFGYED